MQKETLPKTKQTTKLSPSNQELMEQKIPYYNQLSPLWQDFYYQVINKVETTNNKK